VKYQKRVCKKNGKEYQKDQHPKRDNSVARSRPLTTHFFLTISFLCPFGQLPTHLPKLRSVATRDSSPCRVVGEICGCEFSGRWVVTTHRVSDHLNHLNRCIVSPPDRRTTPHVMVHGHSSHPLHERTDVLAV
jgi:hypothetical protein